MLNNFFSGLRHWAEDDDPWVEHARFSIDCYFVLQKKGQEFVDLVRFALNSEAVGLYEPLTIYNVL